MADPVQIDEQQPLPVSHDLWGSPPATAAPKVNRDLWGQTAAPAPPAVTHDLWGQGEVTPEAGHWWNRSIVQSVAGSDVMETGRQKIFSAFKSILPESMRGQFLVDFADEASKAGPGIANFLTSPVGIALMTSHLIPATAPLAAGADVLLGGQQALQAVPDMADAIADPQNGRRWGKVAVDAFGAYAGLKGGARVGEALRAMPADTGAGMPILPKMGATLKAYGKAFRETAPPKQALSSRALNLKNRLDAADPEDRAAILEEASQPANVRESFEKGAYNTPLVRGVANVLAPGVRQPPITELGQYLVDQYIGNIASEQNKVRRSMDWIRRNVPEEDQDIRRMGFAMEGDLPESDLSPEGQRGLEEIRKLNRSRDSMLEESGVSEAALRDPETYIRHYWDFDTPGDPSRKMLIATRMMNDPSLRSRTVGSLKLGMTPEDEGGFGLTPRYNNVTDVVYRRHMEAVRTVENQRFANTLKDYGLIVDPTKDALRSSSWPQATEAPALMKAVYSGETKAGDVIMRPKAPLVHPDIQMAVDTIFGEPFKGVGWNAVNQLAAFSKQIQVGFSIFHLNIISEVAQAHAAGLGGLEMIPRVAKAIAWPLDPEFLKGVRSSILEVRGKVAPDAPPDVSWSRDLVEPWLRAGGSLQSSESEAAAIKAAMEWKPENPLLKPVAAVVRTIGQGQQVFNRALFDYYLPAQWLHSAEHLFADECNRLGPTPTPEAVFAKRQEIADHLNRTCGVENLQHLMLDPKSQQALRLTFFAPMWLLSRLRSLTKGYETTTGARLTNRYVAGAAGTMFLTSQLANYAFSSWYGDPKRYPNKEDGGPGGGEYWDDTTQQVKRGGHWTWQNMGDPVDFGVLPGAGTKSSPAVRNHAADIYFGQNPDGSQRYIRQGKYATDAFLMLVHPEMILNKLSAPIQAAIVQATGHEPGSGFEAIKTETPEQKAHIPEQRIAAAARIATPFSAEPLAQKIEHWAVPTVFREPGASSQVLGMPARRGASYTTSLAALQSAIVSGRDDLIEPILRNAEANGVNLRGAVSQIRRGMRTDARTAAGIPPTAPPPGVQ